uniref:Neur_chan_memb domain-containing protein n=2 Tax=Caenorhabditis tropicalis TaxID=1561998 RepID=A0A1I7UPL7_9PELO
MGTGRSKIHISSPRMSLQEDIDSDDSDASSVSEQPYRPPSNCSFYAKHHLMMEFGLLMLLCLGVVGLILLISLAFKEITPMMPKH